MTTVLHLHLVDDTDLPFDTLTLFKNNKKVMYYLLDISFKIKL